MIAVIAGKLTLTSSQFAYFGDCNALLANVQSKYRMRPRRLSVHVCTGRRATQSTYLQPFQYLHRHTPHNIFSANLPM